MALTADTDIRNEVDVTIELATARVAFEVLIRLLEARTYQMPVGDVLNPYCWLAALPRPPLDAQGIRFSGFPPSASLASVVATVDNVNVNVTCVSCSSPGIIELSELFATESEAITTSAADLVDFITGRVLEGEYVQFQLDRLIRHAGPLCPHSPEFDPDFTSKAVVYEEFDFVKGEDGTSFLLVFGSVLVGVALIALFIYQGNRFMVRQRHQKWLASLSDKEAMKIFENQSKTEQIEAQINESSRHAMFFHPDVPIMVRWSMPVIIIANIGFFLSGHLSKGATVIINAELAGETFHVGDFYTFSVARSSIDMWRAGGKELAALIWIFSVFWPYSKQLISLVVWFLPPSVMTISKRGATMIWLDTLAKWSIVDIFVLVLSLVAFR